MFGVAFTDRQNALKSVYAAASLDCTLLPALHIHMHFCKRKQKQIFEATGKSTPTTRKCSF